MGDAVSKVPEIQRGLLTLYTMYAIILERVYTYTYICIYMVEGASC